MVATSSNSNSLARPRRPHVPKLEAGSDAIARDFIHYFGRTLGRQVIEPGSPLVYQALAFAVRDRMMERRNQSNAAATAQGGRRACYISLEFLMGRLLHNALISLDLEEDCRAALSTFDLSLGEVLETEPDTGLGNGGLGRLAACFLDSCATLGLPVMGYGIRYQYGMFHQQIRDGRQVEEPDPWLRDGFPWEIERFEFAQTVRFGGRSESFVDDEGVQRYRWVETQDILAVPFDIPVPGYRNNVVNTLRLWAAKATDAFDLREFNAGSYADAVAAKNAAENITMVLYPNAASENGQELRLRQQYFLASASLQDTLRSWVKRHGGSMDGFADKHCFQLNDTHPAICVPELMRLLMDEHHLDWDEAWQITSSTMAYTNHTLLPEALELWSVGLFQGLLPRLLDIIYEINARFLSEVSERWPGDTDRMRRMSLIQEGNEPMIRMAYLAIVGSFSVNGVAALHSDLLTSGLFKDFHDLWPQRFNNKTNGVTQRRWLAGCNPALAQLISGTIGDSWVTRLHHLKRLAPHADDPQFCARWQAVKAENKQRLITMVRDKTGVELDASMLFDVQVKRIHEYKRQLLNVLHAVYLYQKIKQGEVESFTPRAIIIGGKAAPGYEMAKNIIKLINNVARVINGDADTTGKLRLVFLPDYNVSAMETICPAAELSAQISTAGKEASGTGNMKLMMNGAITIGTLDGANVEILEAVGKENFFLFGLTVTEVAAQRQSYDPLSLIQADSDFKATIELIESGHFNAFEPGIFDTILAAVKDPGDPWMTAADFRSFVDAQHAVARAYNNPDEWTRMSILNTAASGRFSTDRTMQEYNSEIWRLHPLT